MGTDTVLFEICNNKGTASFKKSYFKGSCCMDKLKSKERFKFYFSNLSQEVNVLPFGHLDVGHFVSLLVPL